MVETRLGLTAYAPCTVSMWWKYTTAMQAVGPFDHLLIAQGAGAASQHAPPWHVHPYTVWLRH
jgi:hypothetical protein